MGGSISDLEKSINKPVTDKKQAQLVMEDALIGEVKKMKRQVDTGVRLQLAILGSVAALVAVPMTDLLTFGLIMPTTKVSLRLLMMSPVIFLILLLTLFGFFWTLCKWFSLWLVMIIAATIFFSVLLLLIVR